MTDEATQQLEAWVQTQVATGQTFVDVRGETVVPNARDSATTRADEHVAGLRTTSRRLAIKGVIGEGGMGLVRLAAQANLGRDVAVKSARPDVAAGTANLEILREAWVTGTLEHPNIVPVYFIDVNEDGTPLIVLKRIEGAAWSELMHDDEAAERYTEGRDLLTWNLEILLHITDAIRYAHSRGIVHRDIKPENVMIGEFGEVYLLDWGIAVSTREDDCPLPRASKASQIAGTPVYMAPEMIDGSGLGPATDIYLLGAVLHEIVTGEPPHMAETLEEVVASVRRESRSYPESVAPELQEICSTAMAKSPSDRYSDAGKLERAIRGFIQHQHSSSLAEEANDGLARLRPLLAAEEATDTDSVYGVFGEVRFGFRAALAAWDANESARRGLAETVELMVNWELENKRPRLAKTRLSEHPAPDAALVQRVDAAVLSLAASEARHAQRDHDDDSSIGQRTRAFSFALSCGVWIAVPVVIELAGWRDKLGFAAMNYIIAALLGMSVALFWWARDSLTKTDFNRRSVLIMLIMLTSHLPLNFGAQLSGISPGTTQVFWLFLWAVIASVETVNFDVKFWPSALGCLIAFGLAVAWPHHRLWFMSAALINLTVNGMVVWGDALLPKNWDRKPSDPGS